MELILSQDLEKYIPSEITFNYDELKTQLAESLDRYNSLVVTEDAIQPAKKDRAALNKLKTAIDDKRKDVKKACLAPYEAFEVKAKELIGMIQAPIDAIDRQVKGFEEQKQQDKFKAIEHFYNDNITELRDLVPLEKILPEKWANSGITLISITQDIMTAITKIRNDIKLIQAMNLVFESQAIDMYLKKFDMSAVLAENKRLEEQAKALEKMQKRRETENSAAVANGNLELYDAPSDQAVRIEELTSDSPEGLKTIKVIFYDTTAAFRHEMKDLTKKHGVKYGGIE